MLTSSELSAPEEKETSGNVLDVKITNFGPISKGRISLRPLTILMGPNNSGKSYAAILVHSVMNAISYVPDADSNIPVDRIVKECENAYKNGKRSLSLSPDMVAKINDAIRETTERRLERRLERNFELDLDDLIQLGAKEATIEIKTKFTHTNMRLTKTDHHFVAMDDVLSSVEINLEKGCDGIGYQLIGGKLFIRHPTHGRPDVQNNLSHIIAHVIWNGGFFQTIPVNLLPRGEIRTGKKIQNVVSKHSRARPEYGTRPRKKFGLVYSYDRLSFRPARHGKNRKKICQYCRLLGT